jgi:hypothetical protein
MYIPGCTAISARRVLRRVRAGITLNVLGHLDPAGWRNGDRERLAQLIRATN